MKRIYSLAAAVFALLITVNFAHAQTFVSKSLNQNGGFTGNWNSTSSWATENGSSTISSTDLSKCLNGTATGCVFTINGFSGTRPTTISMDLSNSSNITLSGATINVNGNGIIDLTYSPNGGNTAASVTIGANSVINFNSTGSMNIGGSKQHVAINNTAVNFSSSATGDVVANDLLSMSGTSINMNNGANGASFTTGGTHTDLNISMNAGSFSLNTGSGKISGTRSGSTSTSTIAISGGSFSIDDAPSGSNLLDGVVVNQVGGSFAVSGNVSPTFNNSYFNVNGGTSNINSTTFLLTSSGNGTTTLKSSAIVYANANANESVINMSSGTKLALLSSSFQIGAAGSGKSIFQLGLQNGGVIINFDNNSQIQLANQNSILEVGNNGNQTTESKIVYNNAVTVFRGKGTSSIPNPSPATSPAFPNGYNPYSTGCGTGTSNTCAGVTGQQSGIIFGPQIASSSSTTPVAGVFQSANPLPVILVGFSANLNSDKTVGLSWNTQQEVNSSHFNVQRSANGTNWTVIGTVQAKGNSSLSSDYTYIDEKPLSGINYYRLQMVDMDERAGYTEVKAVRTTATFGISVFPNPAKDFVNVSISKATSDLSIRMINQLGQVMQETKVSNGTTTIVSMPTHNYPQGTYMLQIKGSDGTQQTSKVLVIK